MWRVGGGGRICVEGAVCAGRLEQAGVRALGWKARGEAGEGSQGQVRMAF